VGTSRDYKETYKPVTRFLKSITDEEKQVLKNAKKSIERRGKKIKAGLQLRACLPELEKRLNELCLTLYPESSKERYKLIKHLGKVVWGVSKVKTCSHCGGKFFGGPKYCTRSCGTSVGCNSPEWIEAHSGDKNGMRTESGKAAFKKGFLKKYGVDNPLKSSKIKEEMKERSLEKYGVEYNTQRPDVKRSIRRSLLKNYGVINNMQRPEVQAKCVKTWAKNWQHGHHLRDPAMLDRVQRKGFQRRPAILNGKVMMVQGYEPQVLSLLKDRMKKAVVKPSLVPKIFYERGGTTGVSRYYPDAVLELQTGKFVLLEVKSWYTITHKNVLEKAKAAFKFCSDYRNLSYRIAVYEPKTNAITWLNSLPRLEQFLSNHAIV
jgi:hypothetical protein